MDTEINFCIGKGSGTFVRLSARIWDNPKLTIRKIRIFIVPVFALLYCTIANMDPINCAGVEN